MNTLLIFKNGERWWCDPGLSFVAERIANDPGFLCQVSDNQNGDRPITAWVCSDAVAIAMAKVT